MCPFWTFFNGLLSGLSLRATMVDPQAMRIVGFCSLPEQRFFAQQARCAVLLGSWGRCVGHARVTGTNGRANRLATW